MSRREYTKEFKRDAVLLSIENGKSIRETADNLGIHSTLLSRWRKEYEGDSDAFRGKGNRSKEAQELFELKKEVASLKMEREILKKALAIFSKSPK